MKKTLRIDIPIKAMQNIGLKYREDKTLEQLPVFKVYRFAVRKIDVLENPFQERIHAFLITGILPFEKIILCLIEHRKGGIAEIKSSRKLEMDMETAEYITKAVSLKLRSDFVFILPK